MNAARISGAPRSVARAEPVGSLLRNRAIRAQIESLFDGVSAGARPLVIGSRAAQVAELHRLADEAIVELVQRQIDAGLDVVTDGEVRRTTFLSGFYDSLDGLDDPDERRRQLDDDGNVVFEVFSEPLFRERLRKGHAAAAEEATFLRAVTDFPFKVTIPAPSTHLLDFIEVQDGAYSTHAAVLEDAVGVTKQIVADAVAAGARGIQFDFPVYPALVADATSPLGPLLSFAYAEGETNETLLEKALAADAAVAEGIPDDVAVGLHVCRGNIEGGFWNGSLAPIAERIFSELPHDRFLFEWEDVGRDGDYSPIRFLPKDRVMVMGVVSTKRSQLEDEDEVVRRIEEAGRHLDLDQLAITAQCGFASIYGDELVGAEEAQWRKLDLLGRVADRIWGR